MGCKDEDLLLDMTVDVHRSLADKVPVNSLED